MKRIRFDPTSPSDVPFSPFSAEEEDKKREPEKKKERKFNPKLNFLFPFPPNSRGGSGGDPNFQVGFLSRTETPLARPCQSARSNRSRTPRSDSHSGVEKTGQFEPLFGFSPSSRPRSMHSGGHGRACGEVLGSSPNTERIGRRKETEKSLQIEVERAR